MSENNGIRSWLGRILSPGVPSNQTGSFQNEAFIRSILKEAKKQRHEANSSIESIPFAILDTETTGFHADAGDEIISIAIAQTINGTVKEDFYSFINPKRDIPQHITELTQIDESHVSKAPVLPDVMDKILSSLSGSVIIGYHIQHDLSFFNHFLWQQGKMKLTQQSVELRQVMEALHKKHFETLDNALDFYKIPYDDRHNAKSDVQSMVKLWQVILKDLRKNHIHSLYDLYTLLNTRS